MPQEAIAVPEEAMSLGNRTSLGKIRRSMLRRSRGRRSGFAHTVGAPPARSNGDTWRLERTTAAMRAPAPEPRVAGHSHHQIKNEKIKNHW
jgi:hypothetical protein